MLNKRWLLIIPLISIIWWSAYEPAREVWYMPPVALITGFSILYNIPWLVRVLHMKPFYYENLEDVEITNNEDVKNRFKFQHWFTISITLLQSIVFCIVLDYIVYNVNNSNLKWQEQVGIIVSYITLYTSIQDKIGKLLLVYFMKRKREHIKRRTSDFQSSDNLDIYINIDIPRSDDLVEIDLGTNTGLQEATV